MHYETITQALDDGISVITLNIPQTVLTSDLDRERRTRCA